MAKKKTQTAATPTAGASQSTGPGKDKTPSKQDAVRRALRQLGKNARPVEIKDFVKTQFGLEMTLDHVSSAKGKVLRKGGKRKAKVKKPAAAAKKPAAAHATAGNIDLKDVAAVKELVKRVGADGLRSLIDLLAR
jgi:hypothetical protein